MSIIEVNNLIFEYPGKRALNNVSLSINQGDIMALVGPNGAGKTTLLQCIAALATPISGTITVDGENIADDPRACHRKMGYLPDFFGLYEDLTVYQCLSYMARAHDLPHSQLEDAIKKAARRLKIEDRLHEKAGQLSRGLKQRLAIAQAIVHEPDVLLLDEPASGLDPEARQSLSSLFLELRDQGMTLIVSSHILVELEDYCTDMTIVRDGNIIEHRLVDHPQSEISLLMVSSHDVESLYHFLEQEPGVSQLQKNTSDCQFQYARDSNKQHQLLKKLLQHDIQVYQFGSIKQNMQDVYLAHVNAQQVTQS